MTDKLQVLDTDAAGYTDVEYYAEEADEETVIKLTELDANRCEQCGEESSETYGIEGDWHDIPVCRDCIESFDYTAELREPEPETLTPREAAEQTAEDAREEFGVEANATAWVVTVDNTAGGVTERNLYGYCDTTAEVNGLDFSYRKVESHGITGTEGPVITVEYY